MFGTVPHISGERRPFRCVCCRDDSRPPAIRHDSLFPVSVGNELRATRRRPLSQKQMTRILFNCGYGAGRTTAPAVSAGGATVDWMNRM